MARLVDLDDAMDIGTLYDWYITACMPYDEPVWTEKHIDELFKDFYVIPKETPVIEAEPVKHGTWKAVPNRILIGGRVATQGTAWECSACNNSSKQYLPTMKYCPNCGARMDGE